MNPCERISVTMVGAEYPVNVGYIARLSKNFGVKRLYLVEPRCDMKVASVYASHGADLLNQARVVTLDTVRNEHDLLVGTTAIRATRAANVNRFAMAPEEAARHITSAKSVSLVFGRDTTGLRNEELSMCDLVTTIDTRTGYRTLNVSHSVAILLYLVSKSPPSPTRFQSKATRETFSKYTYQLAVASGLQKHRSERLRHVAKRISLKSNLTTKEFGLLVSLVRKAAIAIENADDESRSAQAHRASS